MPSSRTETERGWKLLPEAGAPLVSRFSSRRRSPHGARARSSRRRRRSMPCARAADPTMWRTARACRPRPGIARLPAGARRPGLCPVPGGVARDRRRERAAAGRERSGTGRRRHPRDDPRALFRARERAVCRRQLAAHDQRRARQGDHLSAASDLVARSAHAQHADRDRPHARAHEQDLLRHDRGRVRDRLGSRDAHGDAHLAASHIVALSRGFARTGAALRAGVRRLARDDRSEARPSRYGAAQPQRGGGRAAGVAADEQRSAEDLLQLAPCEPPRLRRRARSRSRCGHEARGRGQHELGRLSGPGDPDVLLARQRRLAQRIRFQGTVVSCPQAAARVLVAAERQLRGREEADTRTANRGGRDAPDFREHGAGGDHRHRWAAAARRHSRHIAALRVEHRFAALRRWGQPLLLPGLGPMVLGGIARRAVGLRDTRSAARFRADPGVEPTRLRARRCPGHRRRGKRCSRRRCRRRPRSIAARPRSR